MYWVFSIHFENIFLESGDPFSARRRHGSTRHLAGEILSTTLSGSDHVISRPTHHPTSYTWRVASLTNKTCTGSLLVHFFVLEIFNRWWLTYWMDMNGEIVLSAQCLQHYVDQTSVTCAAQLHVGLGYNNKVGCGHGSRTWQLTQQAACPSFARNHWLG